jgi:hypothetical protein
LIKSTYHLIVFSALFLALLLAFNGRKVVFIRVPLYQSFVLLLLFCVAYDSGSSVVLYTAALVGSSTISVSSLLEHPWERWDGAGAMRRWEKRRG